MYFSSQKEKGPGEHVRRDLPSFLESKNKGGKKCFQTCKIVLLTMKVVALVMLSVLVWITLKGWLSCIIGVVVEAKVRFPVAASAGSYQCRKSPAPHTNYWYLLETSSSFLPEFNWSMFNPIQTLAPPGTSCYCHLSLGVLSISLTVHPNQQTTCPNSCLD